MRDPAATPCREEALRGIYRRQFRELTPLREHILSLLPLDSIESIFEPGCGTGLLGSELQSLTEADYTGMDIDGNMIPRSVGFIEGDAVADPLPADLYVTGFFFSSVGDPGSWLAKVRERISPGGLFAVFAEYDYLAVREEPDTGLAGVLRESLEKDGLVTSHGGKLDLFFRKTGFLKLHGGDVIGKLQRPDKDFLEMHAPRFTGEAPLMSWRVVWGVWKKDGP
ncbi:MAG: class I SAM-dependent methyltransferase [Candidatus Aegiribacteria sp.]